MSMSKDRPDRTTMEGMIWNANEVLTAALDPKTNGVPRSCLEMCRGVVLLSVVEAGFVFSGNVGTGLILSRDRHSGRWSPPTAVGLAGVGFGFVAGAGMKDIIVALMDEVSLKSVAQPGQVKFGSQISLVVGPVGREAEAQVSLSGGGPGIAMAWSFSKGLFGGIALEGAGLLARSEENARFYGTSVTPSQILFEEGAVTVPDTAVESIAELHFKLELIQKGETRVPTDAELEVRERRREAAEARGRAAKTEQGNSVHYIGGSDESTKAEYMKYLSKGT